MDSLDELIQVDKDFSNYSKVNGASSAFAKYLVNDSIQLPNRNNPILGVVNISKTMEGEYQLIWEPQNGKVSKSGDLGYTWGIYTLTLPNGESEKGKYLNVWVKEEGQWKVLVDMGNVTV